MIPASAEFISFAPGALWRRIVSVRGEMAWVVVGQVAAASGGIVGVRLLTHWLPPEAYGQLALGLTLVTLVQQSILSPFTGASLRFFSAARVVGELGSFLEALKRILRIAVVVIAVLLVIGLAAATLIHQHVWIPIMGWCAAFALFSSFSNTLDGMQNAARQRVVVAWHDGLGVWLRFLLGTAVVIQLGAQAANALAGYTLAGLLVFGSQYYFFNRGLLSCKTDETDSIKIEKWRRVIVAYGWPFATWGIFAWAQSASERWALQCFGDATQVAQYAVLFQLGYYPVTMLGGMLVQLLSPMIFHIAGDGNDADQVRRCRRLSTKLALGVIAGTVVLAVIARLLAAKLFSLIVPPSYWAGAYLLPFMVLSGGIYTAGQVSCLAVMSGTSAKPLILPKVATSIFAVALNVAGAYVGGLRGVVVSSLVFSLLHFAWIIFVSLDRGGRKVIPFAGKTA